MVYAVEEPQITDAFKAVIDKTTGRAREDLISSGKIVPSAFFAYPDGTMKVVSLFFKNDLQKATKAGRIREKALAENASAVLVLTEHERTGMAILSGVTDGGSISALLDYSYDKETKAVTSWKLTWTGPAQTILLEGIFNVSIQRG